MKVACISLLVLNILLFAGAGYRLFAVPKDEVDAWKASFSEYLSEELLNDMEMRMMNEGMDWEDLSPVDGDASSGTWGEQSGYEWGQVSDENVTDFSEGDPFAEDTQGQRQEGLNAFKGEVGNRLGGDN